MFENISGTYGEDLSKLPINTEISTSIKDLDEITNGLNLSDLIIGRSNRKRTAMKMSKGKIFPSPFREGMNI